MTTVANPIYDSVFKYLLEDERITRTTLSALLKEEVIEVETKRDEYSNIGRDNKQMQDSTISEQNTTIEEQASTIKTSVQILHKSGMSAGTIAENLNMDLLLVKRYIDNI